MSCDNGSKCMKLCPISTGMALGLTYALSVFVWMGWVAWMGMPASMAGHMLPPSDFMDALMMAGRCFVKGFAFGFVFALIYAFVSCCCRKMCGKKGNCGTGCGCANPNCQCRGK